jgi:alkanesulfonate monooxygenase SsuD/methylene tetrahydromethanopterin reductase-like flavin-dependent oxidoreductase (luciferase family)
MAVDWVLRYDLRSPELGTSTEDLYSAAVEQCEWADAHGCSEVRLSEHHGSDDGYLPSALTLAAAIAVRTSQMRIQIMGVPLTLLDPVVVAEQTAVVDLLSHGRLEVVAVLGYVDSEYAMFGIDPAQRVRVFEEKLAALRSALAGEPIDRFGHEVRVTPTPPESRVRVLVGGNTPASARRAARLGDGYAPMFPPDESLIAVYRDECERLGHSPGRTPLPNGPIQVHVARDPEQGWAQIAPHVLHEFNSYGRWAEQADTTTPYSTITDVSTVREWGLVTVVTPEQCVDLARQIESIGGALILHPLGGGLAPSVGWESLELFVNEVLPALQ